VHGRIPPRGRDNVRLAAYRTGGGEAGNRPAGAIARLLSTVPYVDSVVNLEAAAGGISAEQPAALIERGPRMLRHRGRAVVPGDFEDLAREASPEVARAMVVPTPRAGPGGRVGVIVLARGGLRPTPSTELIDRVDQYLRRRSPATFDLWVAGPGWLRVDVDAELVPVSLELATDVDNAVRGRLRAFLHPLTGGPDGDGWPLGRRVFRSDLQAIVEATTGVDHVRVLTPAEHVTAASPVAGAFLVYSGEHRVRMVGGD
jgi:predicted phage baseplate assembly protein